MDLRYTELNDDDLRVLSACNKSGKIQLTTLALSQSPEELNLAMVFENVWKHRTSLALHRITQFGSNGFVTAMKESRMPSLTSLDISMKEGHRANVEFIDSDAAQNLLSLRLNKVLQSTEDLQNLNEMMSRRKLREHLRKLDLNRSSGTADGIMTSAFLADPFLSLTSLNLSDCGLHSKDLFSLDKSKLSGLKHLDISRNKLIAGKLHLMFHASATWNQLISLKADQPHISESISAFEDFELFSSKVASGSLLSLQSLRVSVRKVDRPTLNLTSGWRELRSLDLVSSGTDDATGFFKPIANAVQEVKFPSLETVSSVTLSQAVQINLSIVQRLRQRNISVYFVNAEREKQMKDITEVPFL